MYFVKIIAGVALVTVAANAAECDNHYEITKEQFDSWYRPCYAEVTENGVVFGDIVPWEDVPDISVPVDPIPVEPEPETDDVSWDAMAEAIMEGVNDV